MAALAIFAIALLTSAPNYFARDIAKRTLQERKACKLAIGLSPANRQEIEARVICLTEIVKDFETIDEDTGCSMVLYDLETQAYRAGKSNLRIATRQACDSAGLAKLDPAPFADHAARDGITISVLHSDSETLTRWWQVHYEKAIARAAARTIRTPTKAVPSGKVKKPWKYDGKAQFEGI